MPCITYKDFNFKAETLATIQAANTIIDEYQAEGYTLTLRQLYYQFVSRDLISNRQSEYNRLGSIVNDARLGGLIDWNSIEDRTRKYIAEFGDESWELDALEPRVLTQLIDHTISDEFIDFSHWENARKSIAANKKKIGKLAANWGKKD